jgi:tetratricopeptide (TPR) repeat protein
MAELPESEIRTLVDQALSRSTSQASWTADDVRAAALLHTAVCLRLLLAGRTSAAFVHLNAAGALVDAANDLGAPAEFAKAWYANVTVIVREAGAPAWADELRNRARDRYTTSTADVAFHHGLEFEKRACEFEEPRGFGMKLSGGLRSAASEYETALRRDPKLHRAALHFGRVRILQGMADAAVPLLEIASASSLRSDRYLALLFLGAIAERNNKLVAAESRYRLALETYRWGHSGRMALARVLSRTGREREARTIVADALEGLRGGIVDPLWTYLAIHGEEAAAVLDLMQAEVWR